MALTPGRWIAIALVAFALAPVIVFRTSDDRNDRYTRRELLAWRFGQANRRLHQAAERWRVELLVDSIRARTATPSSSHRMLFDRSLDSTARRVLAALANEVNGDRPTEPRVLTDVVFVLDTARHIQGIERSGYPGALATTYVLPRPGSPDRCVVIARVRPRGWAEVTSDIARARLLGPCAFYEAFGAPGAGVDQWLRGGGWIYGQLITWNDPASTWTPPSWMRDREYSLREAMGESGARCGKGVDSACARALLQPSPRLVQVRGSVLSVSYNPFARSSFWYSRTWDLGQMSPMLLADIVRDIGAERFAGFWRSGNEPLSAFRAATGVDLPTWTRRWIERVYHPEESGPTFSGSALLWGAAFLIAAVALTVRSAMHRQMA